MQTDATQRKLLLGIVIATLVTYALVIADLAVGGRPDPPPLRAAATLLDGAWRFHPGDDPQWADAHLDDSGWEAIDLTAVPGSHDGDVGLPDYVAGWMARGHPDLHGYAWYRRVVEVPPGHDMWDVLGPTLVDNAYELYWNGQLLGGSGRLGPDPRVVGTRPLRFALPAHAAGTRGLLAVRAYLLPNAVPGPDGGGLHSAPILAPRPASDGLHRAQWNRTIAGYVVDAIEPFAMFALIALALVYRFSGSHKSFVVFAGIALALTGLRRLNNAIVAWTDLQSLPTYAWLASVMWVPTVAAWISAWNRWRARSWRSVDVAAWGLAIVGIIGARGHLPLATSVCRLGSIALFVVIAVRIARGGPMRALALITLASIAAAFFGAELLDPLGIPGIWFPFGIGVSRTQYIYGIVIPLLAVLMVVILRPSSRDVSPT